MSKVSRIDGEKILGRLFIALLATFLTFLLVDNISRRFLPSRPRAGIDARGLYRPPKPYVMAELGYPQTVSPTKGPHEVRIFVTGGSTTVLGEPPIPTLLQREFEEHGCTDITVFNFGAVSQVSGQALARIVFHIVDGAPDIIVFYNGRNDIIQPYDPTDPRPGYPFNFLLYESNPIPESDIRTYPTFALLLYGSNLLRHLIPEYFERQFLPLERLREEVGYGSEEWRERIAHVYVNNLVKAHTIANAFGAEFIVFFQPALEYKDVLSSEEEGNLDGERRQHILNLREKILSMIERVRRDVDLTFVDLSDIYDNVTGPVFLDTVHTRQEHKRTISRTMYTHLVRHVGPCGSSNVAGGPRQGR